MFPKFVSLLLFGIVIAALLFNLNRQAYPELPGELGLQRIDGEKQTLNDFKGKPLLVTFWSPNCVICMRDVEHLNTLYKTHDGGTDFELLAFSMYHDRPDWVIESSQKAGMSYPVYFDLTKKLSQAFGNVIATPTSFLIDPQGEVVYRHAGRLDFELMNKKLTEMTG